MTAEPFLEVVRGAPDDVELAALTAVVAALAAAGAPAGQRPRRSAWADRARPAPAGLPHGPDAWRWSALPR
ncbi:acyl-CoA carboxylase epsilon subunit [Saccharothrix algeriensis]|uniref:Acyl-CoA carboxylase subunit epsilon n=1 Tax=Saccharothrix algeriensis TaxID=173560 RepID=A0ABS2S9H3_9PSEU|nr:acyl-CoA carboxylase epsilon subunit [Saccharothrix algeriensis]MBM7812917.1 hypothetical protein [Saccharothrix algeriensis]